MGNVLGSAGPNPTPEEMESELERLRMHTFKPLNPVNPKLTPLKEVIRIAREEKGEAATEAYEQLRTELFAFNLGESAFDMAEQLFAADPENPRIMALLGETACKYDAVKNKHLRGHWVDRLDLLQRGIDVTRKCMNQYPDYEPCYRSYVLAATRAAEGVYFYRWFKGMGLPQNYEGIMRRGKQGLALNPKDSELLCALGSLSARCADVARFPYGIYNWWKGVPPPSQLYQDAIDYLRRASEESPESLEYLCRLGQAYYQFGDYDHARRCFYEVRDEMTPQSPNDEIWQHRAHTLLAGGFEKSGNWNIRFS